MSALPENVTIGQMKCWPLLGFAPGDYACKCADCKKHFWGDKRAYRCLECAVTAVKGGVSRPEVEPQERIVAAAVFHGSAVSLPPPARHHTILATMALSLKIEPGAVPPENQGFLTSKGRFVNRTEAYYLAWSAKQILKKTGNEHEPVLYSEDLW